MRHRLAVAALLAWGVMAAASGMAAPPEPGMLLVARPELHDARFRDTVVLVLQNDAQGVAGLIVNRPSRLALAEALPTLASTLGQEGSLSYGGPVAPRTLIVLLETEGAPPDPAQKVFASVYLTGPEPLSAWLAKGQPGARYRVFAGYAGWAPGQLGCELARGDWQVLPAEGRMLFSAEAAGLWQELAARNAAPAH